MLFTKALFTVGSTVIFQNQSTLDAFLTMPTAGLGNFSGMDGGYGINRFNYTGIGNCYAGFGFFTTIIVHCPDAGIFYTGTLNQSEPATPNRIIDDVLAILAP